jgi:tetratricopeptide (TPR) repeat protein
MSANAQRERQRRLEAACGYLELNMPQHALRELGRIADPQAILFDFNRLRGEALRAADHFEEALEAYGRALREKPEELGILLGMAWCYKRTSQLPRAIAAMEQAYQAHPKELIVLYNLACYFSLAGEKAQALSWLGRALRMESALRKLHPEQEGGLASWNGVGIFKTSLREQIAEEPDFDPLRNDPDFQYLTGSPT